ncbi:hypothetical protein, conserved [Plasmodium gonderi]|uniref:RAP domain-containing protein n=1 Tax=Plasmodium gonderi TaxID=77519 RepID=A0A1Y1JAZ1_PLAGO|nr:hypothetical protein, conserved [Plasmodium gonderi]GAW79701.1 hypothetical protein, conserved [Plasmodium gonderi]
MNMIIRNIKLCSFKVRRYDDFQGIVRRYNFSLIKNVDELKKAIFNYFHSSNNLVERRKEHEKKIKNIFEEYLGGYPNEDQMIHLCMPSGEESILDEKLRDMKQHAQDRRKSDHMIGHENCSASGEGNNGAHVDKNKFGVMKKKQVEDFAQRTELLRILCTCGIRVSPKILLYYTSEAVVNLRTRLEKHMNDIIKYEEVTELEKYERVNNYYYDREKVNVSFIHMYKSLANTLYSICENTIEPNESYESMKEEIVLNYLNLDDIVRKAPAFLNISILLFLVNSYIWMGKNTKMKNLCIDIMNPYINSISDDEMNISTDDKHYLILALRLYFTSFLYSTDILNQLTSYNKRFISSILLVPNHLEMSNTEQDEKYLYITQFLNRHDRKVELKKVYISPFFYSLSSLKNRVIYIMESHDHYYTNERDTLRSFVLWRHYICAKEGFKMVRLCQRDEYVDLFTEKKRDQILHDQVNKDVYVYDCDEIIRSNVQKHGKGKNLD